MTTPRRSSPPPSALPDAVGVLRSREDITLVARLAARDVAAMTPLYAHFAPQVNALLIRMTRNPADAAELLQEVFLQVWRLAESYAPERGSVAGWIFTIARTRALDLIRGKSRQPLLESPGETSPPEQDDPGISPEGQVIGGETACTLQVALTTLAGPERRVLELAYFEDLSHSAIAARTGLPLGTVKTHCARGMKKLRAALETIEAREDHVP